MSTCAHLPHTAASTHLAHSIITTTASTEVITTGAGGHSVVVTRGLPGPRGLPGIDGLPGQDAQLPPGAAGQVLKHNGITWAAGADNNTTYSNATPSAAGLMTAADKTKLDGIAAEATKNATDAQLRERSSHTGEQAISTVTGLQAALDSKLPATDASVTNAREWTAAAVSQAEAEAGTATTARKWTAQRVRQATIKYVGDWWNSTTVAVSKITGLGNLATTSTNGSTANYLRGDGTWATPPNTNTTYSPATTSANGLMTAADKTKLDGIAANANNYTYTHPTTAGNKHIPSGGASGQILRWSSDGTAAWGADNNTTYSPATTSANGLMTAADKTKLDGIAASANNYTYTHPTTAGNKHIPAGGASGQILRWSSDGTAAWGAENNTTYSAMSAAEATTGTATTGRVITAAVLKGAIATHAPTPTSVSGNAGTATTLATARTINGTSFNGSANITTANWGTARTLTIGSTGKSVNGSGNVAWTLAEIGAAPARMPQTVLSSAGPHTLAVGNHYIITHASCVANMPASPTAGDQLRITNMSGARTPKLQRNGKTFRGVADDVLLNTATAAYLFTFTTNQGWV